MSLPGKRRQKKSVLEENGIFFYEEVGQKLGPPHVQSLGKTLRDSNGSIADRLSIYEEPDLNDDKTTYDLINKQAYVVQLHARQTFERLQAIQERARILQQGSDREPEWVSFYHNRFFAPLAEQSKITDADSRRIAREKYYCDFFEYAFDRRWTLFTEAFRAENNQKGLTQPKPDLVAFFPIYDFEKSSDRVANTTQRWKFKTWPVVDVVENFTAKTLNRLAAHGLQSSVVGAFNGNKKQSIQPSDCVCYPWLIVEYKRNDQKKDIECYCQAANAAAAELMMLRTLVEHSTYEIVPPVVTMTAIGNIVRFWIAYFEKDAEGSEQYHMVCIWQGDVSTVLGIIGLETVLENLHTWAMRTLRPWISHCIDQWKHHLQLESEYSDAQSTADEDAEESRLIVFNGSDSDSKSDTDQHVQDDESTNESHIRNIIRTENEALLKKIESLYMSRTPVAPPVWGARSRTGVKSTQTDEEPRFQQEQWDNSPAPGFLQSMRIPSSLEKKENFSLKKESPAGDLGRDDPLVRAQPTTLARGPVPLAGLTGKTSRSFMSKLGKKITVKLPKPPPVPSSPSPVESSVKTRYSDMLESLRHLDVEDAMSNQKTSEEYRIARLKMSLAALKIERARIELQALVPRPDLANGLSKELPKILDSLQALEDAFPLLLIGRWTNQPIFNEHLEKLVACEKLFSEPLTKPQVSTIFGEAITTPRQHDSKVLGQLQSQVFIGSFLSNCRENEAVGEGKQASSIANGVGPTARTDKTLQPSSIFSSALSQGESEFSNTWGKHAFNFNFDTRSPVKSSMEALWAKGTASINAHDSTINQKDGKLFSSSTINQKDSKLFSSSTINQKDSKLFSSSTMGQKDSKLFGSSTINQKDSKLFGSSTINQKDSKLFSSSTMGQKDDKLLSGSKICRKDAELFSGRAPPDDDEWESTDEEPFPAA